MFKDETPLRSVFCSECGTSLKADNKFCSSCGFATPLGEEGATTTETKSTAADSLSDEIITRIDSASKEILQEAEERNKKYILIGIAFICLYLIFKPNALGISMVDQTSLDCRTYYDTEDHYWEQSESCVEERSGAKMTAVVLFSVALFCFYTATKLPKSEEEGDEDESKGESIEEE